jgi:DNA-binding NarL/FixJ family response regulator
MSLTDSQPKARSIRVLLVDDHATVRQGLRCTLEAYSSIEVVGEAGDGSEVLACIEKLQPTVVVMDIVMPKLDGIAATRLIKAQYPQSGWTHAGTEGLHVVFHEKSGGLRSRGQEEHRG